MKRMPSGGKRQQATGLSPCGGEGYQKSVHKEGACLIFNLKAETFAS